LFLFAFLFPNCYDVGFVKWGQDEQNRFEER
jgi:hypothetical protein